MGINNGGKYETLISFFLRIKQVPTRTSIPTWFRSWNPPYQNLASQHQRSSELTSCRPSRLEHTIPFIACWLFLNCIMCLKLKRCLCLLSSDPFDAWRALLILSSLRSVLLIKHMLSCCVQKSGYNKENIWTCVLLLWQTFDCIWSTDVKNVDDCFIGVASKDSWMELSHCLLFK